MREIRHESDDPTEGVRFFLWQRDELGTIARALVVLAGPNGDAGSTLMIRDTRGNAIVLSGWANSTATQRTAAAIDVLAAAGFARERAAALRTHRVVRLSRTPDGTTTLEEAMGGVTTPHRRPPATAPARTIVVER